MGKKILLFFAVVLITTSSVLADTLPDKSAAKDLANKIMVKVAAADLVAAFNLMKPYIPISATEVDAAALQSKSLREQYGQRYGNPIGYEFIDSKDIGDLLLRLRYVEKTENHVLPWIFYFYKTKKGWMLNSFDWNDNFKPFFTER